MRFFTSSSIPLDKCQPPILLESCQKFNIPIEDLSWPPDWERYRNVPKLLDLLRSLPEDEILICTDAWDVFYMTGPETVKQAFLSYDKPIIFASEHREPTGRWSPRRCTDKPWPFSPTRYKYINGGGFAAYAGALLRMWTSPGFWPSPLPNNQVAYNHWYIEHPDQVSIDTHCRLFMCLFGENTSPEHILNNGKVINRHTGEFPCIVHGNGCKGEVFKLWNTMKFYSNQPSSAYRQPHPTSQVARRNARLREVGGRRR